MIKQQFKFEPGSYGDIGNFMPSIACLKGSMETGWKYYFILVKSEIKYQKEQEAILDATKDLDYAFEQKQMSGSDYVVADSLKSKGYISVENFNIVKEGNLQQNELMSALNIGQIKKTKKIINKSN